MWPSTFFDVAPLKLSDFDIKDQDSMSFIFFTKLVQILERIIDIGSNGSVQDHEKVSFARCYL